MFPKFPSLEQRASQGERRFLGRTAVTGRDLLAGRGFLGGNVSLFGVSFAFEIVGLLLTNDLWSSLPRFGCLSNDPLLGVDGVHSYRCKRSHVVQGLPPLAIPFTAVRALAVVEVGIVIYSLPLARFVFLKSFSFEVV